MKKVTFFVSILFFWFGSFAFGVNAEEVTPKLEGYSETYNTYLDTTLSFTIYSDTEVPEEHWDQIEEILIYVDNTFNRYKTNSEISKLNANAGKGSYPVSDGLYKVIKTALDYANETDGKYNPAIGPLIDLWGPDMVIDRVPTDKEIEAIKDLLKYDEIKMDEKNHQITLPLEGMIIDLGSIAKGYAADLINEKIKELGYEHAIINLGTSSLSLVGERYEEKNDDNHWIIGIRNPNPKFRDKDYYIATVGIIDQTVTTSGTDQRYWYVKDDPTTKYHHILDPDTGFPVHNIIEQVTVISKNAMIGDALSTSLKALGIRDGMELVESKDDVEAIFVTYNREVYISSGIGKEIPFEIYHDSFKIKDISKLGDESKIIYYEPDNNIRKQLLIALSIIVGTGVMIGGAVIIVKKFRRY